MAEGLRRDGEPRTAALAGCPVCGDPSGDVRFELPDRLAGTPGRFSYRGCGRCGSVYQDPRVVPEDLALCYPAAYWALADRPHPRPAPPALRPLPGLRDALRRVVRDAVVGRPGASLAGRVLARSPALRRRAFRDQLPDELLPARDPPGRALDVGCGGGEMLAALSEAGWRAEGVEWNPHVAARARARSGCPVHEGGLLEVPLGEETYDLVVMRHVLEHLPDPPASLRRVRRLLTPSGRAVLVLPSPESLGARLFGVHWLEWDPPRHLCLPSRRALGLLAEAAALSVVRTGSRSDAAAHVFAASRAVREGRRLDLARPAPGSLDALLAWVARALVAAGCDVGEERVLVLSRNGAA